MSNEELERIYEESIKDSLKQTKKNSKLGKEAKPVIVVGKKGSAEELAHQNDFSEGEGYQHVDMPKTIIREFRHPESKKRAMRTYVLLHQEEVEEDDDRRSTMCMNDNGTVEKTLRDTSTADIGDILRRLAEVMKKK